MLRLPEGVFAPYTDIPTNVIFFDTTKATGDIWYYEQPKPEGRKKYSKTVPLTSAELQPCLDWWTARAPNEQAWKIKGIDLIETDEAGRVIACNLDEKNPNAGGVIDHRTPLEIVDSISAKEERILGIVSDIKRTLTELAQ